MIHLIMLGLVGYITYIGLVAYGYVTASRTYLKIALLPDLQKYIRNPNHTQSCKAVTTSANLWVGVWIPAVILTNIALVICWYLFATSVAIETSALVVVAGVTALILARFNTYQFLPIWYVKWAGEITMANDRFGIDVMTSRFAEIGQILAVMDESDQSAPDAATRQNALLYEALVLQAAITKARAHLKDWESALAENKSN